MSWTRRALIGGLVTLAANSVASVGPASAAQARVGVRLAAGGNQTIVMWPATGGRTAVDWRGDTALTLGVSELGPPPTDAVIVAAAAGLRHNVLLASDGTVIGSGLDDYGQIGKLSTVGSKSPNGLGVIAKAKAIAAGAWHTLLLAPDNTVQALGRNSFGELGVNDGINVETPHPDIVTVPGLTEATSPGHNTPSLFVSSPGSSTKFRF